MMKCVFLTEAAAAVVRQHKPWLTEALEAARRVFTRAELTDVGLHVTLVDICVGRDGSARVTGVCVCVCVNVKLLPTHLSFCTSYPGGQMQRNEPSRF